MTARKTIAEKNELSFGANALDIDSLAIQKDKNLETEKTAWIFEDGSALTLCKNTVGVVNEYGLNCNGVA